MKNEIKIYKNACPCGYEIKLTSYWWILLGALIGGMFFGIGAIIGTIIAYILIKNKNEEKKKALFLHKKKCKKEREKE